MCSEGTSAVFSTETTTAWARSSPVLKLQEVLVVTMVVDQALTMGTKVLKVLGVLFMYSTFTIDE